MSASHFRLDGLVALVDCNGIQADGPVVLDMEPVADKWRAFGWDVTEIDGNDMNAIVGALMLARAENGKPKAIILRTLARQGRGAHRDQREVALLPRRRQRMGRHHRRVRAERGSRTMSAPARTLAMGQDEAVAGGRPTVEAPFGRALAKLGQNAAGDRRADRRPRQIHRHPAVPRRLSGSLLQCRHGRAEPRRGRGRPGAHRARSLRHHLRRVRHAPRLRFRGHRLRAFQPEREDHRRPAGPDHRLWRHAPGDRGSGADADDPRA